MSRQNKVNPNHYTIAGRLSPDDLARELRRNRPRPDWHDRREDLPFEPEPARDAGTQHAAATATDVTAPARRATPRKPTVRRAATATVRRPRKAPEGARRKTVARAPKRTVAKPKVAKKAKR